MLTTEDQTAIKKAIFKAVENGCTEPQALFNKLIDTLECIDNLNVVPPITKVGLDGKPLIR